MAVTDETGRERPAATYQPRPIRYLDTWPIGPWQVKVHGINAKLDRGDNPVDQTVIDVSRQLADAYYRSEAEPGDHGLGFAVIHQGGLANWLLLNWWSDTILLHRHLYKADHAEPTTFRTVEGDLLACIWEMHVIEFERQAWIDTMVRNPDGPDPDAYLRARLDTDV
ncbi:MAG: hypothetical protein ACR2PK_02415 [Acidimicrobiales bacterium]